MSSARIYARFSHAVPALAAFVLLASACGASRNEPCAGKVCGSYCNACPPGASCPATVGRCDARGACRSGFDPLSITDPLACGVSCAGDGCGITACDVQAKCGERCRVDASTLGYCDRTGTTCVAGERPVSFTCS